MCELIVRKIILLQILLLLTSCGLFEEAPVQEEAKTEGQKIEDKTTQGYTLDVFIDCGEHNLGAFTIEVEFNKDVFHIKSINPATTTENLIINPTDFTTGKVKIMGYFTSEDGQKGKVKVCVLEFSQVAEGKNNFKAKIINLYTTDSKPIEGQVILSDGKITQ